MIFLHLESSSLTLCKEKTPIQEASNAALVTEVFIRSKRGFWFILQGYPLFFTNSTTDGPVIPRQHKLPRCLNDGAPSVKPATPDLYCRKYFEALDIVCEEIKRQFDQKDLLMKWNILIQPKVWQCRAVFFNLLCLWGYIHVFMHIFINIIDKAHMAARTKWSRGADRKSVV